MALDHIVESVAAGLRSLVSTGAGDITSDRADVLQDLHLAEQAWATDGVLSGPWFLRDGDHVAFTPTTRNGAALTIGGQTTNFIPADRFADYLVNVRDGIERGDFDTEISNALHGSAGVGGIAEVPVPLPREGVQDQVRHAQQNEALARGGRNPDGSLAAIVGSRP